MRLLLDTHTFIWFFKGDRKLSNTAITLIDNEDNEKFISMASMWEMAIKESIGKSDFGLPLKEFVEEQLSSYNDLKLLHINLDHIDVIATLPLHHKDPFDRLLIAQAMVEKIPILSVDVILDAYPVQRLW